jgi:hypothetical protein
MPIQKQHAAPAAAGGVGLGLDNFVEGGGLWDDFDGEILECQFVEFDYNGTIDEPVLAMAVEIRNLEEEDDPTPVEGGGTKNPFVQYYSAGDLKNFVPSADGKEAVPVGSKTGLSKNCKAFKLISSMIKAGFDQTKIGKSIAVFEGSRFHFKRVEDEEREFRGKKNRPGQDEDKGKRRKPETLLAESILAAPATGKPGPGKPNGAARPAPAAAAPARPAAAARPAPPRAVPPPAAPAAPAPSTIDPDAATQAQNYIIEVLAAGDGTHAKIGLSKDFVNWAKVTGLAIPLRNKAIQLLGNDEFLSNPEYGWTYDGETLTLATE